MKITYTSDPYSCVAETMEDYTAAGLPRIAPCPWLDLSVTYDCRASQPCPRGEPTRNYGDRRPDGKCPWGKKPFTITVEVPE